ncbi:1055_t:CDS:2, partial [Racocetra fulgida]
TIKLFEHLDNQPINNLPDNTVHDLIFGFQYLANPPRSEGEDLMNLGEESDKDTVTEVLNNDSTFKSFENNMAKNPSNQARALNNLADQDIEKAFTANQVTDARKLHVIISYLKGPVAKVVEEGEESEKNSESSKDEFEEEELDDYMFNFLTFSKNKNDQYRMVKNLENSLDSKFNNLCELYKELETYLNNFNYLITCPSIINSSSSCSKIYTNQLIETYEVITDLLEFYFEDSNRECTSRSFNIGEISISN